MNKEKYGVKECIEVIKANGVYNPNIQKYFDELDEALTEYEAIKNAIEICKKANEQKYVWIKESWGCCKEKFLDDLDYEVLKNRLYVNSRGMYYSFNLNEYGIYWALTKEELE